MFPKISVFAASAALLSGVSAHIAIRMPIPYGGPAAPGQDYPSTSPITTAGLFPCQFGPSGPYSEKYNNNVAAGGSIPLAFTGSAQHGGGSCQVSLFPVNGNTVSTNPADWKVIHTILGGCPGTGPTATSNGQDAAGRPDGVHCTDNSQTDCTRTFQVPFDENLPSGDFVFAWTWFNKIGNREMYMNCAPITITGGSNDMTFFNQLPSVFVANLPGHCTTAENYSPLLPNPGNSVQVINSAEDNVSVLGLGTCQAGITTIPASSPMGLGAVAPFTPPFMSYTASSVVLATASPTTFSVVSVSQPSPVSRVGSCANPCSPDGPLICLPNNMFGICDHGCAVPQQLAAGTVCSNGQVTRRSLPVAFVA